MVQFQSNITNFSEKDTNPSDIKPFERTHSDPSSSTSTEPTSIDSNNQSDANSPFERKIPLLSTSPLFLELSIPYRFNIMLLLYTQGPLGFTILKRLLHITAGNLDHHLKRLKNLGWTWESTLFSYRPLLQIQLTEEGSIIFRQYIEHLKSLLHFIP